MDPNAALQRIIEAALDGNPNELMSAAQDLAVWLDNGGFRPTRHPGDIRGADGSLIGRKEISDREFLAPLEES